MAVVLVLFPFFLGLLCVGLIVAFPGHTYLLFHIVYILYGGCTPFIEVVFK